MTDALIHLFSASAGMLVAIYVAKLYVGKSLRDLETVLNMCNEMNVKLAKIYVKIEDLELLKAISQEHDRKIIMLEAKKNGRSSRHNSNGRD